MGHAVSVGGRGVFVGGVGVNVGINTLSVVFRVGYSVGGSVVVGVLLVTVVVVVVVVVVVAITRSFCSLRFSSAVGCPSRHQRWRMKVVRHE